MAESSFDWVIYGSGVSALVLAERLGAKGKSVALLNPGKNWGGIFSGMSVHQQMFDIGMTNFEFELFGDPHENLQAYDPDRKGEIGKYVHFVRAYMQRFTSVHPVPTPEMLWDGKRHGDLIISNQFEVLRNLSPELGAKIKAELEEICAKPNSLHPRQKVELTSILEKNSLETVSIANHGKTFYRLFVEPVFNKVLGIRTSEIPGVFHRNGWAPLFYPETLLSQFSSSPQKLKPTVFHYPKQAYFGELIQLIIAAIKKLPNVHCVDGVGPAKMSGNTLSVGEKVYSFGKLGWGAELPLLLGLGKETPPPARASLELFFLQVKRSGVSKPFSVLIDPDDSVPVYRATDQTVCSRREAEVHQIAVECNSKRWKEGDRLEAYLPRYSIDPASVVACEQRSFKGALLIPSLEAMYAFAQLRERASNLSQNLYLFGPSSGFGSVTLNDHVIQALKIAEKEGALA